MGVVNVFDVKEFEPERGIQFILKPEGKTLGWKAEGPDGKLYGGYEKLDDISTETVTEAFGRMYESAVRTLRKVEAENETDKM